MQRRISVHRFRPRPGVFQELSGGNPELFEPGIETMEIPLEVWPKGRRAPLEIGETLGVQVHRVGVAHEVPKGPKIVQRPHRRLRKQRLPKRVGFPRAGLPKRVGFPRAGSPRADEPPLHQGGTMHDPVSGGSPQLTGTTKSTVRSTRGESSA